MLRARARKLAHDLQVALPSVSSPLNSVHCKTNLTEWLLQFQGLLNWLVYTT